MDTRPYQKIIIEKDDELIDIIRKIHSAKNDRVVLTFTESSDILISPINLRVLQQESDEVVKSLVAQIIQNPAGISNAQEAGIVVTDLPIEIDQDLWEEAEINMRARVRKNDDKLKKSHLIDNIRQEEPSKDETPLNEDGENPIDREEKKSEESRLSKDDEDTAEEDLNEEDTTSTNVEPDETFDPESAKEKSELPTRELSDFEKRIAQAMEKSKDGLNTEKSKIVKTGDFVMAIDEDINKVRSRDDAQRQDDGDNNNDTIGSQDLRLLGKDYLSKGNVGSESSGFKGNNPKTQISKMPTVKQSEEYNYVDEGFSSEREEKTFESGQKETVIAGMAENQNHEQRLPNLNNRNFLKSQFREGAVDTEQSTVKSGFAASIASAIGSIKERLSKKFDPRTQSEIQNTSKHKYQPPTVNQPDILGNQNKSGSSLKTSKGNLNNKKGLIIALRILIPLFAVLGVAYFIAYNLLPVIRVKIYIETKPVTVTKEYVGEAGSVFDANLGVLAVKTENFTKELSDSAQTTGKSYRGEKAEGMVTLIYYKDGDLTIPKGSILAKSSDGNITYVTLYDAVFDGDKKESVKIGVQASDVGEEYNLGEGNLLTAPDFDGVTGTVSQDSIKGGYKSEYRAVAQKDIDDLVTSMKQVATDEAISKFKSMSKEGWKIVESSIKSNQDGDTVSDLPVNAEGEMVNVSIKVNSTALFYKESDIIAQSESLLLAEADKLKLFEGLSEIGEKKLKDTESTTTIENVDGNKVTIKLSASALAKPDVNREEIVNNLAGKKWDDGIQYISKLNFTAKPTEVTFNPEWFPQFMWHFPTSKSRLIVTVEEIAKVESGPVPTENTESTEEDIAE
ncbi:MAG TPA: hypothetical protein PLX79_04515 [Candidatus Dojkabacteria bacterium]|nr:hypothetical protein [Candidatus Dojkabacteria bacterium]